MSRSGYVEDYHGDDENLRFGRWAGRVASALRGKRGQKFLRDFVAALDAMPDKRLVTDELETAEGEVCGLGAVGRYRKIAMANVDVENHDTLGGLFDIAPCLAAEVMHQNDQDFISRAHMDTPEQRWTRMRAWAVKQIILAEGELLPAEEA